MTDTPHAKYPPSSTPEEDPVSPALREFCQEFGDDDVIIFHGWDDCVIGVAEQFSSGPILVYDRDAIIAKMVAEEGLTEEDAWDHFYFNIAGAWVGERTPIFLTTRFEPSPKATDGSDASH